MNKQIFFNFSLFSGQWIIIIIIIISPISHARLPDNSVAGVEKNNHSYACPKDGLQSCHLEVSLLFSSILNANFSVL